MERKERDFSEGVGAGEGVGVGVGVGEDGSPDPIISARQSRAQIFLSIPEVTQQL